jgi:hypothetical protein
MPLGRGRKSMETRKARLIEVDDKHWLAVDAGDGEIRIPLSEDKPTEVKSAFNKLLTGLRVGAFNIELEGPGEDLFSQVAKEYLIQLNKEMLAIRAEMAKRGLVGK